MRRPPSHLLVLGAAIIAGGLLRFVALGHQSLSHDEGVTAVTVLQPKLLDTLRVIPHSERTPPLFYALLWGWTRVFGEGVFALRSLSALFGTLAIPAAYLAGRELASRRAGLIAALLVAFNPFLVWYSQEARAYSLLILLSAAALFLFARALRSGHPRDYGLWALASALALASHYYAAFPLAVEAGWLLRRGRRRPAIGAVAVVCAVGLALAPLAAYQARGHSESDSGSGVSLIQRLVNVPVGFGAAQRLGTEGAAATGGGARAVEWGGSLALLAAVGVAGLALRGGGGERRRAVWTAGSICAGALLLPLPLAALGSGYFDTRNLAGAIVPLLVFISVCFAGPARRRAGLTLTGSLAAVFLAITLAIAATHSLQRRDWRAVAEAIPPAKGPRLVIVPYGGNPQILYYLERHGAHRLLPPGHRYLAYAGRLSDTVTLARPAVQAIEVVGPAARRTGPPWRGFRLTATASAQGKPLRLFVAPALTAVDLRALQRRGIVGPKDRLILDGARYP
jgi:mannosyltransferase